MICLIIWRGEKKTLVWLCFEMQNFFYHEVWTVTLLREKNLLKHIRLDHPTYPSWLLSSVFFFLFLSNLDKIQFMKTKATSFCQNMTFPEASCRYHLDREKNVHHWPKSVLLMLPLTLIWPTGLSANKLLISVLWPEQIVWLSFSFHPEVFGQRSVCSFSCQLGPLNCDLITAAVGGVHLWASESRSWCCRKNKATKIDFIEPSIFTC